jgi:penicillin-binding protein 1A
MALPVFGRFFKKVFADSTLNYREHFEYEEPEGFNIDIDCDDNGVEKNGEKLPVFDGFW